MPDPNSTSIPLEEQEKFSRHLYFYPFDSTIINEGQDDNAIYLLREGTVSVEKTSGTKPSRISTIEAVNIFGEMALISRRKRTATIRVISKQAAVYKFQFSDMKVVYSNPSWSELLIARLCNDLIETNTRASELKKGSEQLAQELNSTEEQTALLFNALLSIQKDIATDVVVNTKSWFLLKGMNQLMTNFIRVHLPRVQEKLLENPQAALHKIKSDESFPDSLKHFI